MAFTELTALVHKVEDRHKHYCPRRNYGGRRLIRTVLDATPSETKELHRVAWKVDGKPSNSYSGCKARGRYSKKVSE